MYKCFLQCCDQVEMSTSQLVPLKRNEKILICYCCVVVCPEMCEKCYLVWVLGQTCAYSLRPLTQWYQDSKDVDTEYWWCIRCYVWDRNDSYCAGGCNFSTSWVRCNFPSRNPHLTHFISGNKIKKFICHSIWKQLHVKFYNFIHNPTTVIAEYDRGMFLVAKQKQKTYRIDKSIILFHFARCMTISKTKTNYFGGRVTQLVK